MKEQNPFAQFDPAPVADAPNPFAPFDAQLSMPQTEAPMSQSAQPPSAIDQLKATATDLSETPEQKAALRQQSQAGYEQAMTEANQQKPAYQRFGEGMIRGAKQGALGLGQLEQSAENAMGIQPDPNSLHSLDSQQDMADLAKQYEIQGKGAGIAGTAGELVTPVNAALTSMTGNPLTQGLAARAATGAGMGALQPVTETGSAGNSQRIKNAAESSALNAAIPAIVPTAKYLSTAASNAIAPAASAAVKPLAQKALEYGIPLTRSQIGDSKFAQGLASVAEKMPLTGGVGFRTSQQDAFNKAVASTIGEDADKITPDVINNAYKNIGAKFDAVHSGLQVKVDDNIINQLGSIEDDAKNSITKEHYEIVKNNINKFLGDIDENGVIPGEKLNSLRSNLAKTLKSTRNDASSYLGDIHDLVMNTATADSPEKQALLNEARSQYKNLKTIEPLAAKADRGNITPSLLTNAARQSYSDFARGGGGKLGDLARIGNTFLKDKIPNSGTPERQMLIHGLEGAAAIGTGVASPMTAVAGAGTLGLAKGFNMLNQSQKGVKAALDRIPIKNTFNSKGLSSYISRPAGLLAAKNATE